jgi:hypothetical protein
MHMKIKNVFILLGWLCAFSNAYAQVNCSATVISSGVSCAGGSDGSARVVVNGLSSGTPAGCLTPDAVPTMYTGGCTSTYSSNTGEVDIEPGQQVCLSASNFTGVIQANGGTLVITGNATPSDFRLQSNNPSFTLIIIGSGHFQNLNSFGSTHVENYGTMNVTGSIGFNGTLINNGTINITGDLSINSPVGSFTNKGSVTMSSNFNNLHTTLNGGTIAVGGTFNNNSTSTFNNVCTLTVGGNLNNNTTIINAGTISVGGTSAMNGSSLYQGYGGALLKTVNTTIDGLVQGMSSTCSAIKVSKNTLINGDAVFSGLIDYCDADNIEINNGKFVAPASTNCSCSGVSATYAWQSPLSGT